MGKDLAINLENLSTGYRVKGEDKVISQQLTAELHVGCQAVQATSMQRLMSLFIGQWRTVASVVSMDFAQVQVTPALLKAYSFT